MAVLSAERIKITTTKSPLWCTIIIIVLGLGLATVFGLSAKSSLSNPNGAMMPKRYSLVIASAAMIIRTMTPNPDTPSPASLNVGRNFSKSGVPDAASSLYA